MNKINKIFSCIQILIFFSLTLCGSDIPFQASMRSDEHPCKDHACGCKSEADCLTHCCCSPQGNNVNSYHGVKRQRNTLQSFISSLMCKSGGDVITFINAELKYIFEDDFVIPHIAIISFLTNDIQVHLCEPAVSPPEKPPRRSA